MADHVHEWRLLEYMQNIDWRKDMKVPRIMRLEAASCECGEKLEMVEITRRLNATERLSAEDAQHIINLLPIEESEEIAAYAAALEGEDE